MTEAEEKREGSAAGRLLSSATAEAMPASTVAGAFPFNAFMPQEARLLSDAARHYSEMLEAVYAEAEADGEGDEMASVAHEAVLLRKLEAGFNAVFLASQGR